MLKNSDCIILNSRKYSESSKIISVYSKTYGKISLMAKGAYSNKSKFLGLLETSYIIDAEFYFKENRDLHTLSNADIKYRYKNAKSDFRLLTCAMICCEITNKSQSVGEVNPDLYYDLESTLKSIDEGIGLYNCLIYLNKVISYLGFQITIDENLDREGKIKFNMNNGTFNSESGFLIYKNEFSVVENMINNVSLDIDIELELFNKIYSFMIRYLSIHIEKHININSLELLI